MKNSCVYVKPFTVRCCIGFPTAGFTKMDNDIGFFVPTENGYLLTIR